MPLLRAMRDERFAVAILLAGQVDDLPAAIERLKSQLDVHRQALEELRSRRARDWKRGDRHKAAWLPHVIEIGDQALSDLQQVREREEER